MRSLTQWFEGTRARVFHSTSDGLNQLTTNVRPSLPSICVDHLHAQCSLRERKTSCGNTKCPRAHITLPHEDTPLHDIPELTNHLQYMSTLLVAVDRRSKHSNPLVIRMPTQHALFTVGITKAVDCAFHNGQRVPYVCYDFLERTCAYGSQCYGIHVVDFDLQSVPRERFRAAVGERDLPVEQRGNQQSHQQSSQHVAASMSNASLASLHSVASSRGHHVRTSSQGSDRGPFNGLTSFPTPTREVAIPVPDAFSMSCVETEQPPHWMGMETCSTSAAEEVHHPHQETVRMMHDGVQMVNAAHEANVALMNDVETFFAAAERVLRVAKQTCAQQCQAVVAKRLHDVSEHLQTLLSLQRSPQPPSASLRMTHDILMRNTPHTMRTVAPHESTVSFHGDIIVPRITYARHDGVVENVNPPVAHPPAGWSPIPAYVPNLSSALSGTQQANNNALSTTPPTASSNSATIGLLAGNANMHRNPMTMTSPSQVQAQVSAADAASTDPLLPTYDEEEWAVVQLLQMVQSALSH